VKLSRAPSEQSKHFCTPRRSGSSHSSHVSSQGGAALLAAPATPVVSKYSAGRQISVMVAWLNEMLEPRRVDGIGGAAGARVARRPLSAAEDCDPGVGHEEITFDRPIGAGSFGAVWCCRCRGEVVAVKQCKVGDPKEAEMLLREIRYLQKLRHERLVSFLGYCNRPPHVLLLVEYMPGGSLHALLFGSTQRRLSFKAKVRMAHQVSEGLTYLHDLSIVHRDLKTMNIVLDNSLNCKICDFGLTITLERTHLTVQSLQGSPRYMAPEQFEDNAIITEKVDIWQMGCVMLELFCLARPFQSCSGVQQIITELVVRKRPPQIPVEADPRARVLIHSCVRIERRKRPAAGLLQDALAGIWSSLCDED